MVKDTTKIPPSRTTMLTRAVPPTRYGRLAMLLSCGLMLLFFVPGCTMCIGLEVLVTIVQQPFLAIFCAICAVIFAIPHFSVIMWLDRNEREPIYLIATAFFWGAIMATGASMILNTVNGLIFMDLVGDADTANQMMASLSAPPVEEITKGLALLFIYLFFTKELDNVLDGIVYGALVGLGFAVLENYTYYFRAGAAAGAEGGDAASFAVASIVVYVRGIVTGIGSHACFTAMTGAGFGAFRVLRKGVLRWFLPPLGLFLAIFSHFAWNTFTTFFMFAPESLGITMFVSLPLAVIVLQFPFLILVLLTAAFALRHERKVIEKYLSTERAGIVEPGEIHTLVPYRWKLWNNVKLLVRFDLAKLWRTWRRQKLLVSLAFERWHMDIEDNIGDEEAAHAHAVRVTDIRRRLRSIPLETGEVDLLK